MAILTAFTLIQMDSDSGSVGALEVLTDPATTWTSAFSIFTATSSTGVEVIGTGIFDNFPNKPNNGSIGALTIMHTDPSPTIALTITGISLGFAPFVSSIFNLGGLDGLAAILGGNDRITGSPGGTNVSRESLNGYAGNDIIHGRGGVDGIYGGSGNDRLFGDGGNDSLYGEKGNDVLNGGAGADWLWTGRGYDTLTGGPGADRFVFEGSLGMSNVERITDFSPVLDRFYLAHNGIGAAGTMLTAVAFYTGAHAHDASDRIIYNPAAGVLYYDSNGNAPGGEVTFATLAHNLALSHADFLLG